MRLSRDEIPGRLKAIDDPPGFLLVKGKKTLLYGEEILAVVGSRRPTGQGRRLAFDFAYELAGAGVTIVSGMALGIDAMAHWGAHMAGGATIGVLGCGLDQGYPKRNQALSRVMARDQVLVTEHALGEKPLPRHFPHRNRLISGLALGILVVESEMASGTMTTVNHGLNQGRTIFVIPGSVEDPMKIGNNALIKMGAVPVTTPMDILTYLNLE